MFARSVWLLTNKNTASDIASGLAWLRITAFGPTVKKAEVFEEEGGLMYSPIPKFRWSEDDLIIEELPPTAKVTNGIDIAIASMFEMQKVSDQALSEGLTNTSKSDKMLGRVCADCQPTQE
jgi:hypothetical protein